jgi:hypothetical protein
MRRLVGIAVSAWLVASLPGCGRDAIVPWTFESRTVERTVGECGSDRDSPCGRFLIRYPELVDGPSEDSRRAINEQIARLLLAPGPGGGRAESLGAMATGFLQDYERARAEFPDVASTIRWWFERTARVIYRDDRLLSLELVAAAYTGGAHPNATTTYVSLEPVEGRRLLLSDLLVPGYEAPLNAIAEAEFRVLRGISPGQTLAAAGFWFDDDRFHLNENFAVDTRGLSFHFNPYEIASHAAGPTTLTLTVEELGALVLADGELAHRRTR